MVKVIKRQEGYKTIRAFDSLSLLDVIKLLEVTLIRGTRRVASKWHSLWRRRVRIDYHWQVTTPSPTALVVADRSIYPRAVLRRMLTGADGRHLSPDVCGIVIEGPPSARIRRLIISFSEIYFSVYIAFVSF